MTSSYSFTNILGLSSSHQHNGPASPLTCFKRSYIFVYNSKCMYLTPLFYTDHYLHLANNWYLWIFNGYFADFQYNFMTANIIMFISYPDSWPTYLVRLRHTVIWVCITILEIFQKIKVFILTIYFMLIILFANNRVGNLLKKQRKIFKGRRQKNW